MGELVNTTKGSKCRPRFIGRREDSGPSCLLVTGIGGILVVSERAPD